MWTLPEERNACVGAVWGRLPDDELPARGAGEKLLRCGCRGCRKPVMPRLVAGSEIRFADHGEHHLKGIPDQWRIYRVDGT